MKIGYILKKFPRHSETFILNELLALEKLGHEIHIFSLRQPDDEPLHESLANLRAPVSVIRPNAPKSIFHHLDSLAKMQVGSVRNEFDYYVNRLDLEDPWRLEALRYCVVLVPLIRELSIDHIHAHFATSAAATAQEVALQTGIPFSFTMHAKDIYRSTVCFKTLSNRMTAAKFCVTVCEANALWIRSRCTSEAVKKLHVLYNGIDLDKWKPRENNRENGLFAAVGRFVEKKGFKDLIRACALLRDEGKKYTLKLIGNGELDESLRQLTSKLNLKEQVIFCGPLSQDKVRDIVNSAQALVAPCIKGSDGNQDALPTVMLEAMALKTPCISTPVGGICEIISDGKDGWIVPERSPEKVAQTMRHVLDNPDEVRKFGMAARTKAEQLFNLDSNAGKLAEWFAAKSIINSKMK